MRSLLFVPADRPDRFDKAIASGADAVILDLEDSVTVDRKAAGRDAIAGFLAKARTPRVLVRVNPLDSPFHADDLATLADARPDGLVLPKAEGAASVRQLRTQIDLPILPIATETPAAIFTLGEYRHVADQLLGLTWGAEDLPAAIGATSSRHGDGSYTAPYETARSLTLFAAHAAGTSAIETVSPDFRDLDRLERYAAAGFRDGFTGMMAIHPAQVPVINAAFTPTPAQLDHARRIVAAFAADPHAGALQLDGRMIDAPHLKSARRLLSAAESAAGQ